MPRYPRNYIKTCFFHVITQGIEKTYIFESEEDIEFYLVKMYSLNQECEIKIIAYCIMNNHAHILLETSKVENLAKFMQRLNTAYAKYYNKKYSRVGYVFRNRYRSEGIYNEKYLYNCIKYIHYNPVKAGMCKHPWEYPYSNYKITKELDKDYSEKYLFMDIDEDKNRECKNIIFKFLVDNKVTIKEIKMNKDIMKKIIVTLKDENNISLRKIAELLEVNRESIRKIYNSKQ
ncbi:MAG: transposase [Clostridia bacterium]|nr:transposase [Clostridia bacterium]